MATNAQHSPTVDLHFGSMDWFLGSYNEERSLAALVMRGLPILAAYAVVHGLLVAGGFALSAVPEAAVPFWPAAGLLAGILASTPYRTWVLWIAASLLGRVLFEALLFDNRALQLPLLFSLVNVAEAVVFAVLVKAPMQQAYQQGRPLYLSVMFTLLAFVCAAFGGVLGAAALQALGIDATSFSQAWRLWMAGDFLGVLLVAPGVAWILLPQLRIQRQVAPWPEYVAIGLALAAAFTLAVALSPEAGAPYSGATGAGLAVLMTVPVLWAALRAPFPFVVVMQTVLAVIVVTASRLGYGPFAHDAEEFLPALASIQVFLIATAVVTSVATFAVLERQRAERQSELNRQFTDLLVRLTNQLVSASSDRLRATISESLEAIARFARADRCVLVEVDSESLQVTDAYTWTGPGVSEHPPELIHADLSQLDWVMQQFREKGYVVMRNFGKELPEGAEELRPIQQAVSDTHAAVYVGLFHEGRLTGAIGYGYVRPGVTWSAEALSLMFLVGQLFANILERKNVERELETYRDKLRSLAVDMGITEERARRRTAIDLHDGIGQNLAVARMKLGQVLATTEQDKSELTAVRQLVDEALRGTRYIISDLSPAILYELGLGPALQSLAERFETTNNVTCEVKEEGEPWHPGNDLRIALYRSVQEFLGNIARHAQAENVIIRLIWAADRVDIVVTDDGVGFDPRLSGVTSITSGFGLFSVRESIATLGGFLRVDSEPGLGTTVTLCMPRRGEEDEE